MERHAPASGRPLRVGIIGVGRIAPEHVRGYRAAGAQVVAIADIDPIALAARAAEWGVPFTCPDHEALLARDDIDAVSVCTPNGTHAVVATAAARAGKHVLCEKPLAPSVAEADEIVAACRVAGVVLAVNHHNRSHGAVMRARELLEAGDVGRVCFVRLRQAHDWGGRERVPETFGARALAGGGTLLDNGCHLFDLARHLAGPVREVFARMATLGPAWEVEDTATVSLLFASGALGAVETAWTATGWENGFWVYGTRGALECTNRSGRVLLRHAWRRGPSADWSDIDSTTWEFAGGAGHAGSVAAFVGAVRGEREVACRGEDGREAVRLVLASYQSAGLGRPLRVHGS